MTATPATAPPTMGPVFELLPRDNDAADVGEDEGMDEGVSPGLFDIDVGVVVAGKPVAGGLWVGVPIGVVEGAEPPINWPGPISGLSPAAIELCRFQLFSNVTSRVDQ